jgi:hypothetical protein
MFRYVLYGAIIGSTRWYHNYLISIDIGLYYNYLISTDIGQIWYGLVTLRTMHAIYSKYYFKFSNTFYETRIHIHISNLIVVLLVYQYILVVLKN